MKLIAMSGVSTDDLQEAKLLGARHTFSKPLDLQTLLRTVQHELQH
ncbi:MAG: hypothetical protein OEY86_04655 [Nitrospira sp.]|nr:hypothetical protein [Nitrospira sp.]